MSADKFIILGDSHIVSLRTAWRKKYKKTDAYVDFCPIGPNWISRLAFFEVNGATVQTVPPHARENVFPREDEREAWHVVSFPFNTNRILRDFDWKRFAPWDMVEGAETGISEAVLARMISNETRGAVDFTLALQKVGLKVAVLEAPRVFSAALADNPGRVPVLKAVSDRYRNTLRAIFDEAGIPVLDQPAETIADDGTTLEEWKSLHENDVHHANFRYGKLMLDEMFAELG